MRVGRVIYLVGVPKPGKFSIEFRSCVNCPQWDLYIPFTMTTNVMKLEDWRENFDSAYIKTMGQGRWDEKTHPLDNYLLKANFKFTMKIVCEASSLKIYLNRHLYITWVHLYDPAKATLLDVKGDIRLLQVRFEESEV